MIIKKLAFFIIIFVSGIVFGQPPTKEQLQKQSDALRKEIAAINTELSKTQQQSKLSLAYLANINKKIGLREKVYNNTQKEKRFIEDEIYLQQLEINRQNRALEVLRKNYAEVLVKAYKNKGVQNKVTFILSSKNLGEAIRRVQYLQNYSDYQNREAKKITEASTRLKESIAAREKSIKEKETLLENQKKELAIIGSEKKEKELVLADFKKNEAKLTAQLKQKQAEDKKLKNRIAAIIAEELKAAKAKEEAEKKAEAERRRIAEEIAAKEKARIEEENRAKLAAAAEEKRKAEAEAKKAADLLAKKTAEENKRVADAAKADATEKEEAKKLAAEKATRDAEEKSKAAADKLAAAKATEDALKKKNEDAKKAAETKVFTNFGISSGATAANFAASKGKLGMPVSGNITHRFGRQRHPVYETIWEENNGVKIAVGKGTIAKCVFPGTVSTVIASEDGSKTVMVKHGEYFTVYSNLKNTMVSKNQSISAGSSIGEVGEDFDGSYTLDFQIWSGTTPVDPQLWVN
ncbi:MAG: peptidoglycan DD-metalloendopeptidase family protein [Flavobacteriaceae bacterium]|jgi:septal ring factor EnvC (AmiA/AmiB activator)|nr:peptidoglycan DD-metalloendopeptidase family protein [Flavobacteriaceae bacterium]